MTTATSIFVTVVIDEHTIYQIGVYATPPHIKLLAPNELESLIFINYTVHCNLFLVV
jgi:hypothetical protein